MRFLWFLNCSLLPWRYFQWNGEEINRDSRVFGNKNGPVWTRYSYSVRGNKDASQPDRRLENKAQAVDKGQRRLRVQLRQSKSKNGKRAITSLRIPRRYLRKQRRCKKRIKRCSGPQIKTRIPEHRSRKAKKRSHSPVRRTEISNEGEIRRQNVPADNVNVRASSSKQRLQPVDSFIHPKRDPAESVIVKRLIKIKLKSSSCSVLPKLPELFCKEDTALSCAPFIWSLSCSLWIQAHPISST